jgi:hypothetical protein
MSEGSTQMVGKLQYAALKPFLGQVRLAYNAARSFEVLPKSGNMHASSVCRTNLQYFPVAKICSPKKGFEKSHALTTDVSRLSHRPPAILASVFAESGAITRTSAHFRNSMWSTLRERRNIQTLNEASKCLLDLDRIPQKEGKYIPEVHRGLLRPAQKALLVTTEDLSDVGQLKTSH